METRLELQSKLEELLGSRQVYYQYPESVKMEYPAIVYSKSNIRTINANDAKYSKINRYDITVISKKPDDPVLDRLLNLPYCSYDRHYVTDNLNHDTFILYF
jgi:hypothetical protein